jgi:hypothetical protein
LFASARENSDEHGEITITKLGPLREQLLKCITDRWRYGMWEAFLRTLFETRKECVWVITLWMLQVRSTVWRNEVGTLGSSFGKAGRRHDGALEEDAGLEPGLEERCEDFGEHSVRKHDRDWEVDARAFESNILNTQ